MDDAILASYEELPYNAQPQAYTHPDVLATVGTLMGMTPPPIRGCRVLELGCANGANLLPMAVSYPGSQFVGIDLSPRQIGDGLAVVGELKVANLTLAAMSIMEVEESFGEFDYIICHGVFSWVPPEVQEKILSICSQRLSPSGIAYVSYNTYPGWHMRGMMREMLEYHVRPFADPRAKVREARAFVELMARSLEGLPFRHGDLIAREAAQLRNRDDAYIYHEHLEAENRAIYFDEFVRRCEGHGLRHMTDAIPGNTAMGILAPRLAEALGQWSSEAKRREQYLDFLVNRAFRRSLLCHEGVSLQPALCTAALERMHFSSLVRPVSANPDIRSTAKEAFAGQEGSGMTSSSPLTKAALCVLHDAHPDLMRFEDLAERVRARLSGVGPGGQDAAAGLAVVLMECYRGRLVDAHISPPLFTMHISERPTAFAPARQQANRGQRLVSCLRHFVVELDDFELRLLGRLDGTRNEEDLLGWLESAAAGGQLAVRQEDQAVTDPAQVRQRLRGLLQAALKRIARGALLVA